MPYSFTRKVVGDTLLIADVNELQAAVENMGTEAVLVAASDAPQAIKDRAQYLCDGTDDQVQIQAAHDSFTTGGKVILSVGTFNISAAISIDNDSFTLEGSGNVKPTGATQIGLGTKLQAVTGLTGQVILAGALSTRPIFGCTLKHFTIDGGYIGTATNGITYRSNQGLIFDVHVHRCTGYGVKLLGHSAAETGSVKWDTYDSKLLACMIGDCYDTGNPATATAGGGVWFSDYAPDCHMVECIILNNYDNVRVSSASEQITNCHLYDAVRHNLWFDSSGSRTKVGTCKIEGAGSHGVFIDGTSAGSSDIQLVGCNLKNSGDATNNSADHIYIGGPSTHSRPMIVGCAFSMDSATVNKPRYNINLQSAAQYALVVGCQMGSSTHVGTGYVNDSTSSGTKALITKNYGSAYKDTAGGTASKANGDTVAHGLWRTPTRYSVAATVAGHIAVVTAVDTTNLTIGLTNHDGTAVTVAENVVWWAEA